jgi:hypothetical protein
MKNIMQSLLLLVAFFRCASGNAMPDKSVGLVNTEPVRALGANQMSHHVPYKGGASMKRMKGKKSKMSNKGKKKKGKKKCKGKKCAEGHCKWIESLCRFASRMYLKPFPDTHDFFSIGQTK